MNKEQAKEISKIIKKIEKIEQLLEKDFITYAKEKFGGGSNNYCLELSDDFHHGCAVEGDINQTMYRALKQSIDIGNKLMREAALYELAMCEEKLTRLET